MSKRGFSPIPPARSAPALWWSARKPLLQRCRRRCLGHGMVQPVMS